mgnify:FL=1
MTVKRGWCIWLTGLPGSGKTTIAEELKKILRKHGICVQIVSSDAMRKLVTPNPKYTEEERELVYRAIVFTSKLLTENGTNVIIDATGNRRRFRDLAREEIRKFAEVYVKCPLEVCMKRETKRVDEYAPKDIYKKGLEGKSRTVPGLGVPYEEPLNPEIVVDSEKLDPLGCAQIIFDYIEENFMEL